MSDLENDNFEDIDDFQDVESDEGIVATYDPTKFSEAEQQYGLQWLMRLREAMMPIEKPREVAHLKFLICRTEGAGEDRDPDRDKKSKKATKGKGKGGPEPKGRFVPEMGKTEILPGSGRGTWWRNVGLDGLDVIVREQFMLTSEELWKVPPGHYVAQAGPMEVFVSGPATGLTRMPVQHRGWVTVDATSVGGPLYLEKVKSARWKVVFSSGSSKGDIVVRGRVSLDSDEVAVLTCGTIVEQIAPQELTEDAIVRMPIAFAVNGGSIREPSSSSHASKTRNGWVTCDARAQGGPVFFEPVGPAENSNVDFGGPSRAKPRSDREAKEDEDVPQQSSWDQNRTWKVVNLQELGVSEMPIVARAEPYAPGTGKTPISDMLVRYIQNGDVLEQVGHSKKMRGFMVMPVRIVSLASGEAVSGEKGNPSEVGWVTRRSVDKNSAVWFVEIVAGEERSSRERRKR
eukprot:TRINITY_DN27269_c0_g1_i1.p1 TRINITY_DN27269_c0_g1~~TRINITY_DN27269_c0_g1_i1.p1  ORF type:complete len:481 (+),score=98.74 TRINITY_DN27269_c0_g1_i1:70-1443(+)